MKEILRGKRSVKNRFYERISMASSQKQKFILHENDQGVRLTVWGKTPKEVFSCALAGIAAHTIGESPAPARERDFVSQEIRARAVDINSLLVEFLSEVLARQEMDNVVFSSALFSEFGENFLSGEIRGIPMDRNQHRVRAIGYDTVDVHKNEKGVYECTLVLEA